MIRHRAKHTVYPSPRACPFAPSPSLRAHPTHVLDVPVRETRSACHCLARRALDLPQRIEHSPDFLSASLRAKRRRRHISQREKREEEKNARPRSQYAWYIQDMSFVGRGVAPIHPHPSVRVYVLEEKGNGDRPCQPFLALSLSLFLSIPRSLRYYSIFLFHPSSRARSSALSKLADGQRTPRGLCSSGLESEILIF